MRSGIYRIVNTKTGRCYVGQTNDLARRKDEHMRKLRNGKHSNKQLQNDFNEDKIFFRFEILEYCSYDKLGEREDFWAHHFDCWKNGYNHQATDSRNYLRTKESINKNVESTIVIQEKNNDDTEEKPVITNMNFFKGK